MPTHDACPRLIIDCFVPALREETLPHPISKIIAACKYNGNNNVG